MNREDCGPCDQLRFWAPWGLLIAGAIVASIPSMPAVAKQGAAYLVAFALVLMIGSIALRLRTRHGNHHVL
jgi:hypothetical protein